MVGIVIVSHSIRVAEGIRDMAAQMSKPNQRILAAGGATDGSIGTDALKIYEAIKNADEGDGVLIIVDLGSAILSTETALELLHEDLRNRVKIADAPVLEGSISAVVQASLGGSLSEVLTTAEAARELHKR